MQYPHLKDCTILVVEDEPLIVLDITMAFETAGAHMTSTNTLKHARLLVEHDGLSAVILDNALPDGNGGSLCTRLTELGIPFLMYSGVQSTDESCQAAPHLSKPATHEMLRAMPWKG